MLSFLFHGFECAFWCFVWHNFHHWWAHSHKTHYTPPPPGTHAEREFRQLLQGGDIL